MVLFRIQKVGSIHQIKHEASTSGGLRHKLHCCFVIVVIVSLCPPRITPKQYQQPRFIIFLFSSQVQRKSAMNVIT